MPSREELHRLIDSLPDGAIDPAHRTLSHLQVWPPAPPPDAQEIRERMQKNMDARRLKALQLHKPLKMTGFVGSGNYDPSQESASGSFSHWHGDTYVTETFRRHRGHEFTVTERVRVQENRLIYKHEIRGPGEQHDEREINFEA